MSGESRDAELLRKAELAAVRARSMRSQRSSAQIVSERTVTLTTAGGLTSTATLPTHRHASGESSTLPDLTPDGLLLPSVSSAASLRMATTLERARAARLSSPQSTEGGPASPPPAGWPPFACTAAVGEAATAATAAARQAAFGAQDAARNWLNDLEGTIRNS